MMVRDPTSVIRFNRTPSCKDSSLVFEIDGPGMCLATLIQQKMYTSATCLKHFVVPC